jgi:membrane-bound lytic murein transglycosylase D
MTAIKIFLFIFIVLFVTASDIDYGVENPFIRKIEIKDEHVEEVAWPTIDKVDIYLNDQEKKVSPEFRVTAFYRPNVYFWFLVYTEFESSQIIIHDKSNLRLIYKVLDFSALYDKDLPKFTIYTLQEKLADEKISQIKEQLLHLSKNPLSRDGKSKAILGTLKLAGIKLPAGQTERADYFKKLYEGIRTQTGQSNFIRDGLIRSLPYQEFISRFLKAKNLPKEIFSIPFLESSFNPIAQSKVNALGIWQFMPLIASFYVPKRTIHIDYRSNVGVASVAAGFLMTENYKLLKSWDLAVTAYNSGTKHLLQSRRKLASIGVDLEMIIKNSDSNRFGFASKNFYSEFLALTRVLAYRDDVFDDLHDHERDDVDEELHFYLTKCALLLPKVLNETQLGDVLFHNDQIKDEKKSYPRGVILTSKSQLPKSKFLELSLKQLTEKKPKDWDVYLKNQSCSTR